MKKIAIVTKNLQRGGAQKSAAMLSLMLTDIGHEISLVLLYNEIEFNFKGDLYVLFDEKKQQNFFRKISQFLKLKKYIHKNNFDYIIDFRGRYNPLREFLIYKFIYKNPKKVIFTIRDAKLEDYIPRPFIFFKSFYRNAYRVMVVSKEMENNLKKQYPLQNTVAINNGINFKEIDALKNVSTPFNGDYILAAGRFVKRKQFKELVEAYAKTKLASLNIKLLIIGEGRLEVEIKEAISKNKLEDFVTILPFQNNPYKYMSNAKFLVLPSIREGFPNVLVEALTCNIPVVSFNCKTGPSEIVQHEQNGLLVKDQDFDELINALNRLAEDGELYVYCKNNARNSVEKFNMEKVSLIWGNLLK